MAAIDEIKLDTLSLADLKAAEAFTYDIPLPDGVDNLSGVTSVTLTILFDDIRLPDGGRHAVRLREPDDRA